MKAIITGGGTGGHIYPRARRRPRPCGRCSSCHSTGRRANRRRAQTALSSATVPRRPWRNPHQHARALQPHRPRDPGLPGPGPPPAPPRGLLLLRAAGGGAAGGARRRPVEPRPRPRALGVRGRAPAHSTSASRAAMRPTPSTMASSPVA